MVPYGKQIIDAPDLLAAVVADLRGNRKNKPRARGLGWRGNGALGLWGRNESALPTMNSTSSE